MNLSARQIADLVELQRSESIFERLIERLYLGSIRKGDTVVDGGALVGQHTIPMSKAVGPSGRVIAFEPVPATAAYLQTLVAELGNVDLVCKALATYEGTAKFHVFNDAPWFSSLMDRFAWFETLPKAEQPPIKREDAIVIDVPTTTLDHYAAASVSFIKLDLEGGEYDALRGAVGMLRQHRPVVCLECAGLPQAAAFGYSREEFFSFFVENDYRLVDLFGQPYTPAQFEDHTLKSGVPGYLIAYPSGRDDVSAMATRNAVLTAWVAQKRV